MKVKTVLEMTFFAFNLVAVRNEFRIELCIDVADGRTLLDRGVAGVPFFGPAETVDEIPLFDTDGGEMGVL